MPEASKQQIALLHHTLGLRPEQREGRRNHFVAGPGHYDMPDLETLESMGLMARARTPAFCDQSDIVFMATDAGRALALEKLPEPLPPAKRTQHGQWVDADSGYSFSEWLCGHQLPKLETEATHGLLNGRYKRMPRYRMYRLQKNSHWHRDVEGQWASTKKEAKASYKVALKAHQQAQRAQAQEKD